MSWNLEQRLFSFFHSPWTKYKTILPTTQPQQACGHTNKMDMQHWSHTYTHICNVHCQSVGSLVCSSLQLGLSANHSNRPNLSVSFSLSHHHLSWRLSSIDLLSKIWRVIWVNKLHIELHYLLFLLSRTCIEASHGSSSFRDFFFFISFFVFCCFVFFFGMVVLIGNLEVR